MISKTEQLKELIKACGFNRSSLAMAIVRYAFSRARGLDLLRGDRVHIHGLKNIHISGQLKIGLSKVGFADADDRCLLNIRGRMNVKGYFSIARGCRLDIGPEAVFDVQSGYLNPFTLVVVTRGISIGDDCAISWNCQFIDDDFHSIEPSTSGAITAEPIAIGDHVWIGSSVTVLRGSFIASGCVVAAGAVVRGKFTEENCLIGGIPARVIRRGIRWC